MADLGPDSLAELATGWENGRLMPQFRVLVPFDPVIHEDLDSRVFTHLPDCELVGGLKIRRTAEGYVAELEVDAPRLGAAKQLVLEATERLLAVLASWNHGFQVRVGGVMSEMIADDSPVATSSIAPGVIAVSASDTMFLEDHVEAVVRKASLDAEEGVYRRYAELPESVRSCLELNLWVPRTPSAQFKRLFGTRGRGRPNDRFFVASDLR